MPLLAVLVHLDRCRAQGAEETHPRDQDCLAGPAAGADRAGAESTAQNGPNADPHDSLAQTKGHRLSASRLMVNVKQVLLARLLRTRRVLSNALLTPSAPVPQQYSPEAALGPFTIEWRRGYRRIPAVYIVRQLQARSRPRQCWPIYLVLISEWPLALNLALYLVHPQWAAVRGRAMLWIAGFGLTVALMLLSAMVAWTFPGDRGQLFDQIIASSPQQLDVTKWLARFMSYRRQLLIPIAGAVSGPIFLYFIRHEIERTIALAFPSYLLVSWTSFVGGNVAYWLWVAPGLAKQLHRCQNINLRWQDPAALLDPANGRWVWYSRYVSACRTLPWRTGFWLPKVLNAPGEVYLLFAFFGVAVCTSIRVTVVPMTWVWIMVTKRKRAAMAIIDQKLPDLGAPDAKSAAIEKWITIYQAVSNAPALPFSTGAMVQYGAAMAGSIFGFLHWPGFQDIGICKDRTSAGRHARRQCVSMPFATITRQRLRQATADSSMGQNILGF